jgi:hypothetical protein
MRIFSVIVFPLHKHVAQETVRSRHATERFFFSPQRSKKSSKKQSLFEPCASLWLFNVREQQVEEEAVAAAWREKVDRLRGWIVAG